MDGNFQRTMNGRIGVNSPQPHKGKSDTTDVPRRSNLDLEAVAGELNEFRAFSLRKPAPRVKWRVRNEDGKPRMCPICKSVPLTVCWGAVGTGE